MGIWFKVLEIHRSKCVRTLYLLLGRCYPVPANNGTRFREANAALLRAWCRMHCCMNKYWDVCVCVWGVQGVVFLSTFLPCLLFWSLVMWLKSINHQSNSLGSLTHELRGRSRGGKCQESFQWTLSICCSDWERKEGSLATEGVWGALWAPSSPFKSLLISRGEEAWDRQPRPVSKSTLGGRLDEFVGSFPESRHLNKDLWIFSEFLSDGTPLFILLLLLHRLSISPRCTTSSASSRTGSTRQGWPTSRGRGRPRPSWASCALCPLSPTTEGGKPEKKRDGFLSCLSEWIAVFSGASVQFKRTAAALTWLSDCFLAASSPLIPLARHSHVSFFSSETLCNSKQLNCHINSAVSQVQHYEPICLSLLLRGTQTVSVRTNKQGYTLWFQRCREAGNEHECFY